MPKTFVHSGKLGDLVYSIPVAFTLDVSRYLIVAKSPGHGRNTNVESVVPLLLHCGFDVDITYGLGAVHAERDWVDGDRLFVAQKRLGLNQEGRFLNIVERHFVAQNLPIDSWHGPWLGVQPECVADRIFVRSGRYRPAVSCVDFSALGRVGVDRSVFIGTDREHAEFCWDFGVRVRRHVVSDLLVAARCMAGSVLVAGNQSSLVAVGHGLGCNVLLERCERIDDCVFGERWRWNS